MTTKPKAKKFRISRSSRLGNSDASSRAGEGDIFAKRVQAAVDQNKSDKDVAQSGSTPETEPNPLEQIAQSPTEDGFPAEGFTGKSTSSQPSSEKLGDNYDEIEAIRKEGLTGRQLRMARRVAQKHGIAVDSDFDAVLKLRRAGIDPFKRSNMLELVGADGAGRGGAGVPGTLPQPAAPRLPANHVYNDEDRARTVREIQMDIVRRRRRKLAFLFARLAFFVFLPTLIVGIYYYNYATPMYATKSEFVIQKADGAGGAGLGGLFAGSGLATSQDSITVQSYLTSRDAMLRLNKDLGYKAVFSSPDIDAIQRLGPDATNEQAYKLYMKYVKIGYDPTEGIMRMEVVAPTPVLSEDFSEALISYAEQRVDNLTQRLREDQMEGSIASYDKAEKDMLTAQGEVLRLQEEMGVFDATSDASALMAQVTGFESQLQEKRLSLQQLLDNSKPNKARVDGLRGDIGRLEALIAELRGRLTETGGENGSLASISGRLRIAQTNLETRTVLMQQSLQQLEVARVEANKQTRYLELGVRPVAPDEPTYPRSFENTILAFLIFAGIYLMASITGSILREQVSA